MINLMLFFSLKDNVENISVLRFFIPLGKPYLDVFII